MGGGRVGNSPTPKGVAIVQFNLIFYINFAVFRTGSRSANPPDIFLEALRTAVVGDDDVNDVDEDEDDDFVMLAPDRGLRDVRMTALNATLTNMGIAPSISRTIERLLSRATGRSVSHSLPLSLPPPYPLPPLSLSHIQYFT